MQIKNKIQLIPLDLRKGHKHEHPDLKTGPYYLVKINNRFHAGQFVRVWFGWVFDSWIMNSMQYDKPGTNHSGWQGIWEIQPIKRERKRHGADRRQS